MCGGRRRAAAPDLARDGAARDLGGRVTRSGAYPVAGSPGQRIGGQTSGGGPGRAPAPLVGAAGHHTGAAQRMLEQRSPIRVGPGTRHATGLALSLGPTGGRDGVAAALRKRRLAMLVAHADISVIRCATVRKRSQQSQVYNAHAMGAKGEVAWAQWRPAGAAMAAHHGVAPHSRRTRYARSARLVLRRHDRSERPKYPHAPLARHRDLAVKRLLRVKRRSPPAYEVNANAAVLDFVAGEGGARGISREHGVNTIPTRPGGRSWHSAVESPAGPVGRVRHAVILFRSSSSSAFVGWNRRLRPSVAVRNIRARMSSIAVNRTASGAYSGHRGMGSPARAEGCVRTVALGATPQSATQPRPTASRP